MKQTKYLSIMQYKSGPSGMQMIVRTTHTLPWGVGNQGFNNWEVTQTSASHSVKPLHMPDAEPLYYSRLNSSLSFFTQHGFWMVPVPKIHELYYIF